jgi:hypothetical protein
MREGSFAFVDVYQKLGVEREEEMRCKILAQRVLVRG